MSRPQQNLRGMLLTFYIVWNITGHYSKSIQLQMAILLLKLIIIHKFHNLTKASRAWILSSIVSSMLQDVKLTFHYSSVFFFLKCWNLDRVKNDFQNKKSFFFLKCIHHLHISHNTPCSPLPLRNLSFFLLVIKVVPRQIKTMLMQGKLGGIRSDARMANDSPAILS